LYPKLTVPIVFARDKKLTFLLILAAAFCNAAELAA